MKRLFAIAIGCFLTLISGSSPSAQTDAVSERARRLHFSSIVLDTHIDVTPKLQTEWKFGEEHTAGHIDLPRIRRGGLSGLFFSIYMQERYWAKGGQRRSRENRCRSQAG
jgi:hypothetical protein